MRKGKIQIQPTNNNISVNIFIHQGGIKTQIITKLNSNFQYFSYKIEKHGIKKCFLFPYLKFEVDRVHLLEKYHWCHIILLFISYLFFIFLHFELFVLILLFYLFYWDTMIYKTILMFRHTLSLHHIHQGFLPFARALHPSSQSKGRSIL